MAAKLFQRRHFMITAAAAATATGLTPSWAKPLNRKSLDPVDPDILFGTTSSIWGGAGVGAKQTHDTPWAIKRVAEVGLQGIEFYGDGIEAVSRQSDGIEKAAGRCGHRLHRRVQRREGPVHQLHRSRPDPQDHGRSCRFLPRLPAAAGLRSLEDQHGPAPAGRPQRRAAQAPGRHAERAGQPRPSPWACACRPIPISGDRWSARRTCAGCWIIPIPNMSG